MTDGERSCVGYQYHKPVLGKPIPMPHNADVKYYRNDDPWIRCYVFGPGVAEAAEPPWKDACIQMNDEDACYADTRIGQAVCKRRPCVENLCVVKEKAKEGGGFETSESHKNYVRTGTHHGNRDENEDAETNENNKDEV